MFNDEIAVELTTVLLALAFPSIAPAVPDTGLLSVRSKVHPVDKLSIDVCADVYIL
ncbi:hypothetical protein SDC9_174224 [bioreactor metagenome]|uniref:Uncharacterized protein n=1 Tax=bioreactor metagenome TaxID=1076179 RepID=A0A645GLR1_9ZZZZ